MDRQELGMGSEILILLLDVLYGWSLICFECEVDVFEVFCVKKVFLRDQSQFDTPLWTFGVGDQIRKLGRKFFICN